MAGTTYSSTSTGALAPDASTSIPALVEHGGGAAPSARRLASRHGFRAQLRLLRRSPMGLLGLAVVVFWIVMAIAWPVVAPYGPNAFHVSSRFSPPSAQFLLGTDQFGRDVLSRVLAGSRDVLVVAPIATLVGVVGGILLGALAGYRPGWLSEAVLRLMDAIMAFPIVPLTLLIVAMLGPSLVNVILVIGFVFAPRVGRVVYASVLGVRDLNFVAAARMRGEPGRSIFFREILPTITAPIIVEATVRVGYAIFASATLSFLGLGVPPPAADWGLQIADNRSFIQTAPWTVLAPAVAIASLVIALNLVSDALQGGEGIAS